jgi:hypothetical protein
MAARRSAVFDDEKVPNRAGFGLLEEARERPVARTMLRRNMVLSLDGRRSELTALRRWIAA